MNAASKVGSGSDRPESRSWPICLAMTAPALVLLSRKRQLGEILGGGEIPVMCGQAQFSLLPWNDQRSFRAWGSSVGIQAIKKLSNFRRNRPGVLRKHRQGGFSIQEITMSVIANYCGTVILLRQLVKEGYCTNKEATRIAALIARQTGVDIKLPIG